MVNSCKLGKIATTALLFLLAAHQISTASSEGAGFLARGFESNDGAAARGMRKGRKLIDRLFGTETASQELAEALTEAMGYGHGLSSEMQEAKTERVRPMFESMPKMMNGRVDRGAMQYMVLRYFGAEHGWSIKGFDPASTWGQNGSEASAGSSSVSLLKQKLPDYVEEVMEHRLEHQGFSLSDVVTVIVVLERMIFDESLQMLEDAYYLQSRETDHLLGLSELMDIVCTYMMIYGFEADPRNRTDLRVTIGKISEGYPKGWPTAIYGIAQMKTVLREVQLDNPFAMLPGYSFEDAARIVTKASEGYGKWTNEAQCQELKGTMAELDQEGTGRVRLADFYKLGSVGNNWFMVETLDYLRNVGVLDESTASKGPQVIISNYVQSPSNCLEVSSFYAICCLKECEGLLGKIEQEVRAPMVAPARLIPVVQRLIDANEETPRNLSEHMTTLLEVVAEDHGGQVPLHGRLFQQWLHYVFPYECPYPQSTTEAVNWQVVSEYTKRTGLPTELTQEEIERFIKENGVGEETNEEEGKEVPGRERDILDQDLFSVDTYGNEEKWMTEWTLEEELYVGFHHQGPRVGIRGSGWVVPRLGVLIGGFLALRPLWSRAYRGLFGLSDAAQAQAEVWPAAEKLRVL